MRRRVFVLLIAALAAGALAFETTAATAGASADSRNHHSVVEKKKKKKKAKCDNAAIKAAYDAVLNGAQGLTPQQKEPYIESMDTNAALRAQFETTFAASADAAKGLTPVVNSITCAKSGKSASVDYDLSLNGTLNKDLVTAPGKAVLDGGSWKVSATTICDLQALGNPSILDAGACADIINGTG